MTFAAERVAEALGRGSQPDALEARQMQALSLGVHIPIVCFGIAFPAMILFVEGVYLRTGDVTYRRSRSAGRRWR
jgi:cytochrome bd ubiquinol oxidase subunit I